MTEEHLGKPEAVTRQISLAESLPGGKGPSAYRYEKIRVARKDAIFRFRTFRYNGGDVAVEIVLTTEYFGWSATGPLGPFGHIVLGFRGAAKEYNAVPLSQVVCLEIEQGGMFAWGPSVSVRLRLGEAEELVLRFNSILEIGRWIDAFRRVGVPIQGAEPYDPHTWKGFWNVYGRFLRDCGVLAVFGVLSVVYGPIGTIVGLMFAQAVALWTFLRSVWWSGTPRHPHYKG